MSAAHCQSIKPSVKGGFNSHISGDRKRGDLFFVQMLSYLSAYNTTPVINPTIQCLFFQINFFSISPIQFLWCSSLIYYFTFDTTEALTLKHNLQRISHEIRTIKLTMKQKILVLFRDGILMNTSIQK